MADASNVPEIRRANKTGVSEFLGVTLPTVDRWTREGMPFVQRGGRGSQWLFDLNEVARWHYEGRAAEGGRDPEAMDPNDRKQWYDGEMKRRELQVRDRELIQASELEETIATAFAFVAHSMLALPDNLERRSGLAPEHTEAIEQAIHEAMDELATRLAAFAPMDAA